MSAELHLCPSCACHLRLPARLTAMRCNSCNAELVLIDEGGVRGLAMLPTSHGVIPYSHPGQRGSFNGRALLTERRAAVMALAKRRQFFWAALFFGSVVLLAAILGWGVLAGRGISSESHAEVEHAAFAFLMAMITLPILGFTALYFQGRARLMGEEATRWPE